MVARFGDAPEPGVRERVAIALVNKGAVSARQGDIAATLPAWERALELSRGAADETLTVVAISLATLAAFDGGLDRAGQLLKLAEENGLEHAEAYATALSTDFDKRQVAVGSLKEALEDSDALNFLGIAAIADGQRDAARDYWSRSAELGDAVAPLLLAVTSPDASAS